MAMFLKDEAMRNSFAAVLLLVGGMVHAVPSSLVPVVAGISAAGISLQLVVGLVSVIVAIEMFMSQ